MMKRALAIALMGLGVSLTGHGSASAAAISIAAAAAPLAHIGGDSLAPAGSNRCWWDVPLIAPKVAFFELLLDEEVDYHCSGYTDAERYDEPKYHPRARCEGSDCPRAIRPARRGRHAPAD